MRTITTKDKRGLLIAFRVFLRAMSGERLSQQAGDAILDKALDSGLSFDEILNKENWRRALAIIPTGLTAKDYIDILCEHRIDVREIKDEPMWHDVNNGFAIVAEAAHDFFMEVCGRGGKWNIPSALTNLAKAIKEHSLQAILSEKLITEVTEPDSEMTYFGYISAIIRDFNSLQIEDAPTEAQAARRQEEEDILHNAVSPGKEESEGEAARREEENESPEQTPGPEETPAGGQEQEEEEEEIQPEDDPFPEPEEDDDFNNLQFETLITTQNTPRDMKKDSLRLVLENYTPTELLGLVATIEGGESMYVSDLIDYLTDGRFDPAKESADTRKVHQNISADLMPMFIDCVRSQNIDMDDSLAANYDILKDSWDLRTPQVRKLHKLKKLILTYGLEDGDLMESIQDIEKLYSE